jgi:hypothetical protein
MADGSRTFVDVIVADLAAILDSPNPNTRKRIYYVEHTSLWAAVEPRVRQNTFGSLFNAAA